MSNLGKKVNSNDSNNKRPNNSSVKSTTAEIKNKSQRREHDTDKPPIEINEHQTVDTADVERKVQSAATLCSGDLSSLLTYRNLPGIRGVPAVVVFGLLLVTNPAGYKKAVESSLIYYTPGPGMPKSAFPLQPVAVYNPEDDIILDSGRSEQQMRAFAPNFRANGQTSATATRLTQAQQETARRAAEEADRAAVEADRARMPEPLKQQWALLEQFRSWTVTAVVPTNSSSSSSQSPPEPAVENPLDGMRAKYEAEFQAWRTANPAPAPAVPAEEVPVGAAMKLLPLDSPDRCTLFFGDKYIDERYDEGAVWLLHQPTGSRVYLRKDDLKQIEQDRANMSRAAADARASIERKAKEFFVIMWDKLIGPNLKRKLEADAEYRKLVANDSKDPVALYNLAETYLRNPRKEHQEEVCAMKRRELSQLRVGRNERLNDFATRYRNLMDQMEATGVSNYTPKDYIAEFIVLVKEHPSYGPLLTTIDRTRQLMPLPAGVAKHEWTSIEQLVDVVDLQYSQDKHAETVQRKHQGRQDQTPQGVFAATNDAPPKGVQTKGGKAQKKDAKPQQNNSRKPAPPRDNAESEESVLLECKPVRKCTMCAGPHRSRHCPEVRKAGEEALRRKSEGKTYAAVAPSRELHRAPAAAASGETEKPKGDLVEPWVREKDNYPLPTVPMDEPGFVALARHYQVPDITWDTGSDEHVFSDASILTNYRKARYPKVLNGVGGPIRLDYEGWLNNFGWVYHSPDSPANLISQGRAFEEAKEHGTKWKSGGEDEGGWVKGRGPNGEVWEFKRVADPNDKRLHLDWDSAVYIATVTGNERGRTKQEVLRARKAAMLKPDLVFMSDADMRFYLNRGMLNGVDITSRDVTNMTEIYGRNQGELKAKTTEHATKFWKDEEVVYRGKKEQILSADIMYCENTPFFIAIADPLGLVYCVDIANKGHSELSRAIGIVCNQFRRRGFIITEMRFDSESAINQCEDKLSELKIKLNRLASGVHAVVVERCIRTIKERVRAILFTLPYRLPYHLLKWAVMNGVFGKNIMPLPYNEGIAMSPWEIFSGRKLDYERDLCAMGTYVQFKTPPSLMSNSVTLPRTMGGIVMFNTGNVSGDRIVYNPVTNRCVTVRQMVRLPITDAAIEVINQIHDRGRRMFRMDARFRIGRWEGGREVEDDPLDLQDETIVEMDELPAVELVEPSPEGGTDIYDKEYMDAVYTEKDYGEELPINTTVTDVAVEEPISTDPDRSSPAVSPTPPVLPQDEQPLPPFSPATPATNDHLADIQAAIEVLGRPARTRKATLHGDGTPLVEAHLVKHTQGFGCVFLSKAECIRDVGKDATDLATLNELQAMLTKKVMQPVHRRKLPKGVIVIPSKIFYTLKTDEFGNLVRVKGRLVAGGHRQDKSLYDDISSPTIATESIFILASIAARERRTVVVLDPPTTGIGGNNLYGIIL